MKRSTDSVTKAPGIPEHALEQLLERARHGDGEAQDRLFTDCRSYVAVLARAQVEAWMRAKVDSSDLCQQTLLDAFCGIRDFRGTTAEEWLAWLRAILRRNALQFVRTYRQTEKRQVGREVPLDGGKASTDGDAHQPLADEPGPSTILIGREQELRLADALLTLPSDYQDVIMLRHVQRLPFDEVARRMGRSRPAVQMLWLRALRKLEEKVCL
jgi:RNA polymerase sigma-70 factor (ECF subfamily)